MRNANCSTCGSPIKKPRIFCSHLCHSKAQATGHIKPAGYRQIRINGAYILEHRYVVEQSLGRKLLRSEAVHHIDGNKLNNCLPNLRVMSNVDHSREHHPLTWDIEAAKAMLALGNTRKEVGKVLGVSESAIKHALRRRGLSTRVLRPAHLRFPHRR
ncbi:HNH endonuclease [Sphingomonas sp.]|uniref:HNH endonuclease n=1 Tax=Sphingomonas sp. TaxID=28214 RepID=UPI003568524C